MGADGARKVDFGARATMMCWTSALTYGAISFLRANRPDTRGAGGRQWADPEHTLARFRYRSHSEWEFDNYGDRYMLPGCRANETKGSLCGFGKQGLSSVRVVASPHSLFSRLSNLFGYQKTLVDRDVAGGRGG